jgi:ribonuclease P/MRP protein subunit POP5
MADQKKPKPIPASLRPTRRYIAYQVISEEKIPYADLANAIWHAILNFLGEFGVSEAEIWLVKNLYDEKKQAGIIRCSHRYLERIRAALSLVQRIGDTRVVIKVLGVSGTIKATQMKYFSETSLTEFT